MSEFDDDAPVDPIASGDLDGVLRLIDDLVDDHDWEQLSAARQRCLIAYERGHQLWPAAAHAAYRLALEAPAEHAVEPVLDDDNRFGLGPLSEVVALQHSWDKLAPLLPVGPIRTAVAQVRAMVGDDVPDAEGRDLQAEIASWEPSYVLPTYQRYEVDEGPSPIGPTGTDLLSVLLPADRPVGRHDEVTDALRACVAAWLEQSNGRVELAAVDGSAVDAIAALGLPRAAMGEISVGEVAQTLAWCAASGGAQGRRRGVAAGRFDAWWTIAAATNLTDDWPVSGDELGGAAADLGWYRWTPGHALTGWELHLAIEDPLDGLAWAIAAVDAT